MASLSLAAAGVAELLSVARLGAGRWTSLRKGRKPSPYADDALSVQAALGTVLLLASVRPTWRRPALTAGTLASGLRVFGPLAESIAGAPNWRRLAPRAGGLIALVALLRESARADRWEAA